MLTKGYADGPGGQIHWRMWTADAPTEAPDLYCFHPSPYSGLAFQNLAPLLAPSRRVIAPDYPGYGGSHPGDLKPDIASYTAAMAAVVEALSGDAPVDVLGFHTGCLVAADIAVERRARVRRACLIDAPTFGKDMRAKLAMGNAAPPDLTEDISCLEKTWTMSFVKRLKSQGRDQAFEMFAEHLRPGAAMNAGFYAAFTYQWEDRFGDVKQPTLVLASHSSLLEATRAAAGVLPQATLIEDQSIERSVLDENASKITPHITRFLG